MKSTSELEKNCEWDGVWHDGRDDVGEDEWYGGGYGGWNDGGDYGGDDLDDVGDGRWDEMMEEMNEEMMDDMWWFDDRGDEMIWGNGGDNTMG